MEPSSAFSRGKRAQVSVPANLLLLGEYAVLEEGGLGVTIAAEPRVVALIYPADELVISGSWGSQRIDWPNSDGRTLFDCVLRAAAARLGGSVGGMSRLPLRVEIDSSAFYGHEGAKSGFGSSAAVAAALTYTLLAAAAPEEDLLTRTFTTALEAHRAFQDGRGSGYDVAASVFGGIGRFVGGRMPRFRQVDPEWLPTMAVFRGKSPVKTPGAVEKYGQWRAANRDEAEGFLAESNRCVDGFLASADWEEAKGWFEAARELGLSLGEKIGVHADLEIPPGFAGAPVKALGAGNEIGLVFLHEGGGARDCRPVEIASVGVVREGILGSGNHDGR
jgi:phosphomevalonate kinase